MADGSEPEDEFDDELDDDDDEDEENSDGEPRTGQRGRGGRRGGGGAAARGAAGGRGRATAAPKSRRATKAEKTAFAVFVPAVIRVTTDGPVALFVAGPETAAKLAEGEKSLLAVYEFLAQERPPMGTFQSAIDTLPGASSKKLDGMRRVLSLSITTDLDKLTSLLRHRDIKPILKAEHTESLSSADDTKALAKLVQAMLVTLERNSQYAPKRGRTEEARAAWSHWCRARARAGAGARHARSRSRRRR